MSSSDFMKSASEALRRIKAGRIVPEKLPAGLKRKKPTESTNSVFLLIRSFEGDTGDRPTNQGCWLSPDLNVFPLGAGPQAQEHTRIEPGRRYQIECLVHNLGDLDVPQATVEFFLADPALGWRVSASEPLGIATTSVPGRGPQDYGAGRVLLDWTARAQDAGHRCLFARVSSLSPPDLPEDFDALVPTRDRHVGQQNLAVLEPEEEFDFKVFPMEGVWESRKFKVALRPLYKLPRKVQLHPAMRDIDFIGTRKLPEFALRLQKHQPETKAEVELSKPLAATPKLGLWQGRIFRGDQAAMALTMGRMKLGRNQARAFELVGLDPATGEETGSILVLVRRRK